MIELNDVAVWIVIAAAIAVYIGLHILGGWFNDQ